MTQFPKPVLIEKITNLETKIATIKESNFKHKHTISVLKNDILKLRQEHLSKNLNQKNDQKEKYEKQKQEIEAKFQAIIQQKDELTAQIQNKLDNIYNEVGVKQ